MSEPLRVLSLFAGIGGFDLGLERTGGFKTVAFCEIDPFCRRVLAKHWPGVPCFEDVRTLTQECLATAGISDVDVITGGFPCQDVSSAGKQAGIDGGRSGLWSEIVRLAGELRPRVIIVENVSGLLTGEGGAWFSKVLGDLAALGYDAEWECIPACAVGAPHRRDRVWIVAYAAEELRDRVSIPRAFANQEPDQGFKRVWAYVSALKSRRRPPSDYSRLRANDGVSSRVDALAALGNAVTPPIARIIGQALREAHLAIVDRSASAPRRETGVARKGESGGAGTADAQNPSFINIGNNIMGRGSLDIELGWPAKELSPNTPVHYMKRNRFKNAAKTEAGWATKFAIQNDRNWEPAAETVSVHLIAHPPKHWSTGDRDNFAARCKSHLDGIAHALGINDKHFGSPTVTWADKTERGKLIVSIG